MTREGVRQMVSSWMEERAGLPHSLSDSYRTTALILMYIHVYVYLQCTGGGGGGGGEGCTYTS